MNHCIEEKHIKFQEEQEGDLKSLHDCLPVTEATSLHIPLQNRQSTLSGQPSVL
jgi:hypothetical protein